MTKCSEGLIDVLLFLAIELVELKTKKLQDTMSPTQRNIVPDCNMVLIEYHMHR